MSGSQPSGRSADHEPGLNQPRTSAERADVVGTWTGAKAAALQKASRKSQEAFAEHLGISSRAVAKWHQRPGAQLRPVTSELLDTVLRRAPHDVRERFAMLTADVVELRRAPEGNLGDPGGGVSDDEEMLRRQFLLSSAAALTAVGLTGLVRSGRAPRLSTANVGELEVVTDAQRQLYHSVPPHAIWSAVKGHLELLIELMRAPQPEQVRRRIAALGGEAAGLLAWLALDLGEERWCERMHDVALSLTTEAGDRPLDAYVRGFRSQVRQLEGRPHAALALANQAVATARVGRRGSVHAWLRSRQAVALAEVQERRGSMAALAAAEAALPEGTADEPAWMYGFDQVRLTAVRGECLLRLDQPAHAQGAFESALAARGERAGRFQVELLTGLATAVARQGRVDEACNLGMRSLDLAAVGSGLAIDRVRQLRRELDRWHDLDQVVALDDRLESA